MHPFIYARPDSITTAVQEFMPAGSDTFVTTKFIAGGTNLIDLMKQDVERPAKLVDINRLPLTTIAELPDGGLRLGALVTNADTAYHPLVQQRYPLLSETILAGASPQLRNAATNGGNLLQRTRCYYFYDTATPCNKRDQTNAGAPGCGAIGGYNRVCGILGTAPPPVRQSDRSSQCIATHPSDMCVALAALEAVVRVTGPQGERTIPMADFHRLPGDEPWLDNTLQPGELVTAIDLPAQGFAQHYTYLKLRDRTSYAFALVSVAVGLEMDRNRTGGPAGRGEQIINARLAMGGVAHKPWRKPEAEQLLMGQPARPKTYERAANALLAGANGYGDNTFKIELARRAIVWALGKAAGQND